MANSRCKAKLAVLNSCTILSLLLKLLLTDRFPSYYTLLYIYNILQTTDNILTLAIWSAILPRSQLYVAKTNADILNRKENDNKEPPMLALACSVSSIVIGSGP